MSRLWNWLAACTAAAAPAAPLHLAGAAEAPLWSSLVKVAAILSAFVGVVLLALFLMQRLAPRGRRPPDLIRVLATHYLNPKQTLILVAVGPEKFLLASSTNQLSIIPLAAAADGAAPEERPAPT